MQLGYVVRAFAQPSVRFSAFRPARRGLQASARVVQYLQGNVPATHVFAHPLLRRKRQWTLAIDPDDRLQRLPDVCVVDKHAKFSVKDAEFAHQLFEQVYASEGASDQKRSMSLVLRSDEVCYKALAYLRSKGIQLISPKSIAPTPSSASAAAAAATTTDQSRRAAPQAPKPKVDVSDLRVAKEFKLRAPFASSTYQDTAVNILAEGVMQKRRKFQTLMGATGTGKTFMMGKVIEKVQRPTLVLAPNKLLAAQLYDEMKALFPENAVEFFVSYYDYFLPEAYISSSDAYIDKVVDINHDIDRLRHSATRSLVERSDVIVVASVSCIYGLGLPQDYVQQATRLWVGKEYKLNELVDTLISLAYKPSPSQPTTGEVARGFFHVQLPAAADAGSQGVITIGPSAEEASISLTVDISPHGDDSAAPTNITIRAISKQGPNAAITAQDVEKLEHVVLYPATHHVMSEEDKHTILESIQEELDARFEQLVSQQKFLEAERLRQRTESDLMMLQAVGYCKGIENYSRHLSRRAPGEAPACLLDYFPNDWLLLVDESHISVPQVQGMYAGDRARKLNLVKHGFRLPSALDNRPLTASEFWGKVGQCVFVSATPGSNEAIRCTTSSGATSSHEAPGNAATTQSLPLRERDRPSTVERVSSRFTPTWGAVSSDEAAAFLRNEVAVQNRWWDAEVVIRPTGILDPQVEIRPSSNQLAELMQEIQDRRAKGERVLITAITKAMAEDLAAYINEQGFRASYLHSSIKPMERLEILRSLREGDVDAVVGVNLLREGLNLPEVSLVVILDADKEGFLRSDTSLIQTIGRASRHVEGKVIMYADIVTDSMRRAISETNRRRSVQAEYNRIHGITPRTAHLSPTENQLLTMIEHSAKGKSTLNADRVAARLQNEEAYNLSEEEDLMRDFAGLQSPARELTPPELQKWQAQIEAKLQEVVADRKYELAMCLVRLRELCKQRQAASAAAATAGSM